MKGFAITLTGLLSFLIGLSVCEAAKNPSLEENCSYATQDTHNVDRYAYNDILRKLRGDTTPRQSKRRTRPRKQGKGSTGQR